MKKSMVGLSLAILLLPSIASAQQLAAATPEAPKTKLEAFQSQAGKVVIKGYADIGRINGNGDVEVTSMEFTDAATGQKVSGVVIQVREGDRLSSTDRSFIDYDEIDSLMRGLDYISRTTTDVSKLGNFEATYKTKGNFSATTYNSSSAGAVKAAVKCGYIRPSTAYVSLEQLGQLKDMIVQAKLKLDSAK